jgi:3-methyladenine DNA glycosylase AlkD
MNHCLPHRLADDVARAACSDPELIPDRQRASEPVLGAPGRRRIIGRIDAWAVDSNFWVRRSALLTQLLPLKQGAAFDTFAGYADAMLEEKGFFIRKAIGWVLRETSKRRADEVYRWLLPRASRASGVTLREAVKYLDPAQREAILAAAAKPTP